MHFGKVATIVAVLAATLASVSTAQPPEQQSGSMTADMATAPPQDSTSNSASPLLEKADLEAWLDGMVPYALKSGDIAGMVIAVVKDGNVLLQKGYGFADVEKKVPMDPDRTMVRAGSTSKLFTWTAVMQLVEEGKLDLDADVNQYLDFKIAHPAGKPITLRDLMNHRAGFEEGLKDILATDPIGLQSTEQYLKTHPRPLLFVPGDVPAYSNYGAALAGYIVERASGESFERYVEHHILVPLGMMDTSLDQPLQERFESKVSKGYIVASAPLRAYELVVTRPAGSATTTASDMTRFMIAHLQMGRFADRQILNPETTRRMHSPSQVALPGFATMAHGFFYAVQNGRTVIGHGGDTVLFHTEMNLLPDDGVGIFYTFNSRGKDDAVYGARQGLFDGFMDRYFPAPQTPPLAPALASAAADAEEIAGLYQSSRRVEHGFLTLFYLLQQAQLTANPDGTITVPGFSGDAVFREVAPRLWHEVGGSRQLTLTDVDGVKTVIDSENPISVLQGVPFARSAPLNLAVLLGSFAVLVWTIVLWPLGALLRWGDHAQSGVSADVRRVRLLARAAALIDVVYLAAWFMLLQPILSNRLDVYSVRLDSTVRILQYSGLAVLAAAVAGIWIVWRVFRLDAPWLSRTWSVIVAIALLGIVWIGVMGNLLSFNLNY